MLLAPPFTTPYPCVMSQGVMIHSKPTRALSVLPQLHDHLRNICMQTHKVLAVSRLSYCIQKWATWSWTLKHSGLGLSPWSREPYKVQRKLSMTGYLFTKLEERAQTVTVCLQQMHEGEMKINRLFEQKKTHCLPGDRGNTS